MDETSWQSTAWAIASALGTVLATALTLLWAVLLLLLRIIAWPLSALLRLVLFLLSPVIYIIQYAAAPLLFFAGLLSKLEPLYIYFGCAAFIGLVAGLVLRLTSATVSSSFGMDQEPEPRPRDDDYAGPAQQRRPSAGAARRLLLAPEKRQLNAYPYHDGGPLGKGGNLPPFDDDEYDEDDDGSGDVAASGSHDADWQWLESTSPPPPPPLAGGGGKRRYQTRGLLSQIIHEEEDDSDL